MHTLQYKENYLRPKKETSPALLGVLRKRAMHMSLAWVQGQSDWQMSMQDSPMPQKASEGWRGGSVGKVFARQASGLQFRSLAQPWKKSVVLYICDPSVGKVEKMGPSLETTSQQS